MHPTLEREEQNHTVRTVSGRASKEGEITLKPTLFGQTSSLSLSLPLPVYGSARTHFTAAVLAPLL